jgi:hypothetical protein
MDKQIFQLPGIIVSDKSLANGARQFKVETLEAIKPNALHQMLTMEGKPGHFTFCAELIEADDLVELPKLERSKYPQGKTPSQRLRAELWLYHQEKGGTEKDFPAFYEKAIDAFIAQVREKRD